MQPDAVVDVASDSFWKQPFRVPASSDPDTATAQTIDIMAGHIRDSARDALVQQTAGNAALQFGGFAGGEGRAQLAGAAWWWCKTYVKFVHHELILRNRLGEAGHLQGLIAPEVLVRMDRPEGDCAIFTECVCSFLRVLGVPYEVVTVAVNPNEPDIFSHVFAYAVLEDGTRLPLDASHGDYPGWQVPGSHVSRRQVWDENGRKVSDKGSRFDGLHNYGIRAGLGDPCNSSDADYDYFSCTAYGNVPFTGTPGPVFPGQGACTCVNGTCIEDGNSCSTGAPSQIVVPATGSAAWANLSAQLAKQGMSVIQMQNLKPGMVIRPDGTILQQNPGYSVPTVFGTGINQALGTSGNTGLILAGVAAVGLLLFMGKK